ncbi:hypothetical protein [Gramella sp. AN32]|nr:hypothetical protein [Gramella sp. AN32]
MYLFIFSMLFVIFIYVNDKKILDSKEQRIQSLETKLAASDIESSETVESNMDNEDYFSFQDNESAYTYFENRGIDPEKLQVKLEEDLINQNSATIDNSSVPFDGMNGTMKINKVKVLNHKWILADFTDGTYWGELFITYVVEDDGTITYTTEKSFLYPQS